MPREKRNDLLAFLTVAHERSFTHAAAQLGVSHPRSDTASAGWRRS